MKIRLEVKLQDCWIGAYWKRSCNGDLHIWICLLPCLPVHIVILNRSDSFAHEHFNYEQVQLDQQAREYQRWENDYYPY